MIDKALFDEYSNALGTNADLAAAAAVELVRRTEGVPESERAEALLVGYTAVVSSYGAIAAQIALEFYEEARAAYAPKDPYDAQAYPADDSNLLPYDVEDATRMSGGDVGKLALRLSGTASQRTMEHADQTLMSNARRDPARPKWALVPRPWACDWCRMLGSRGFDYVSKETASASRHDNCKCTPVVDFDVDNPSLDGYDHEGLYEYYRDKLKDRWGGRRGGSGEGRPKRPPAGWDTKEKIFENLESASSVDELMAMDSKAVSAIASIAPTEGLRRNMMDSARKIAKRRLALLKAQEGA